MSDGDASWELQQAIVSALKNDSGVVAIVAGKVRDAPTPTEVKPYISYGPSDLTTDIAAEYEGSDETIQLDGWTAGPNRKQSKQLGKAIRAALHEKQLTLPDNQRLVSLIVESTRYLTEPDGITQHVAVTVRALTEPSA